MSDRKPRPTKVDEFRHSLTPEQDDEFIRIAGLPNIAVRDIYGWLVDQNYQGSIRGVYTWFDSHRRAGEKAEKFNQLLESYEGVAAEKVLQKLLITFTEQLDTAIEQLALSDQPLQAGDWLKALPHLGREIRSCVTAMNQLATIRDRKAIEMAGVYRACQELRLIFVDGPFETALEEAIKSVTTRIENEG